MSEKSGKTHDYKETQHRRAKDRWVKRNPPGLNRKARRELAKGIRRAR
jgi:hypothetical protein